MLKTVGNPSTRYGDQSIVDGNLVIGTAGKGVDFSANGGDVLTQYDEGTWNPIFKSSGGSFTTMTMDVVSAVYTRIGRQVTVTAHIRTSNVDATGASGELYVDGLPFVCGYRAPVNIGIAEAWTGDVPGAGYIFPGTAFFYLTYRTTSNGSDQLLQVSDITTGALASQNVIVLSASYFV